MAPHSGKVCDQKILKLDVTIAAIGLYRDVWIAAIASSRKSLATQTAAICVRFHGRRVRHVYVTMQITFLARKSALIYRRGLRQRVASLTIDCNGVFAIRAYRGLPYASITERRAAITACRTEMVKRRLDKYLRTVPETKLTFLDMQGYEELSLTAYSTWLSLPGPS